MIVPAPSKFMLVLAIFHIFVQAAPHEPSLSSSSARELLKRGNTGSETGGTTIDEHDGDLEFSWLLENNIFEGLDIPELPPPSSLPLEAPLVGPPAPLNIINDPALPVLPLAPAAPVAPLPPVAPAPVAAPIPQPVPPPATGNPDNKRKTAEGGKVIKARRRKKSTGNDDSNPISSEKSDNSRRGKHYLPTCGDPPAILDISNTHTRLYDHCGACRCDDKHRLLKCSDSPHHPRKHMHEKNEQCATEFNCICDWKKEIQEHLTCDPFWQKYCGQCNCYLSNKGVYTLISCNQNDFFKSLIKQFPFVVNSEMASYHCGNPKFGNCKCNGQQVKLKEPLSYGPALAKIQAWASLLAQAQS